MMLYKKDSIVTLLALSLALSVSANFLAAYYLRVMFSQTVDDSRYTYEEEDHPIALPIRPEYVALKFDEPKDAQYTLASSRAWSEWHSLDKFPHAAGFVRLGPNGRGFGVSMFHQLHCLDKIRGALLRGQVAYHTNHCFHFLRQAILCASDTTLDALDLVGRVGSDGMGVTHVCRDWTQVYDYVRANQESWHSRFNSSIP